MMITIKQNKLASLLKQKLSNLFHNKYNIIININRVYISSDFKIAKIYISCLPEQNNNFIYQLQRLYNKYYKYKLIQLIRYNIKKLPILIFYLDYSLYHMNTVDQALKREGEILIK